MWSETWLDVPIQSVAFDPEGQAVALGGHDECRIWGLKYNRELARIPLSGDLGIGFGDRYLYGAQNLSPVLSLAYWRPHDLLAEAADRLSRGLSYDEWDLYLEGEPYPT